MTEFDGWPQDLSAGWLPVGARRRLASMRAGHAFTSGLTVDEHHAIRAVGFAPVGQVMGSCVYAFGDTTSWNCGYSILSGFPNSVWPNTPVAAEVREVAGMRRAAYEARQRAVDRMRQECLGLGGDGVVAVQLTATSFPAGGVEFRAVGTAVRAAGDVRPPEPFMSDLTGQDFAKLIHASWVPCGLAMGLEILVRHDDSPMWMRDGLWRNVEMSGHTELVQAARMSARDRLRQEGLRFGGAGVVVRSVTLNVYERPCGIRQREGHDHRAEAVVIGTAITPFRHADSTLWPAPLPVMRLH